jgi:hypothetical protein
LPVKRADFAWPTGATDAHKKRNRWFRWYLIAACFDAASLPCEVLFPQLAYIGCSSISAYDPKKTIQGQRIRIKI